MRERAHLAGGWVTAGPDGEQFRVTAFVPYGLHAAGAAAERPLAEQMLEGCRAVEAAQLELEAAPLEGARPEAAVRG